MSQVLPLTKKKASNQSESLRLRPNPTAVSKAGGKFRGECSRKVQGEVTSVGSVEVTGVWLIKVFD